MSDFHVIPNNDLREHKASENCWCNPVQDEECATVWVHPPMDGRVDFETGERLAS